MSIVGASTNHGVLGGSFNSPKKLHKRERKQKPSIAANLFQRKKKKKKVPKEVCKNMIARYFLVKRDIER